MKLLVLFLITFPVAAASWELSVGVLIGTNAADAISSRGLYELNPVLGRGPFGRRQVSVKGAIIGGSIAFQNWSVRRYPQSRKALTILNFASSAAISAVAVRNWKLR